MRGGEQDKRTKTPLIVLYFLSWWSTGRSLEDFGTAKKIERSEEEDVVAQIILIIWC